MRVLYLSYDGVLDPLGRSQIIPYLEELSRRGHRFTLLSFEKPERWADSELRARLREQARAADIEWRPLPYHRSPAVLSTVWDLYQGHRVARSVLAAGRFDLVHVRSYPCATIARSLWTGLGIPYLFDMRGFYAEERVDGGLWKPGGALYRGTKRLESGFLRDAAGVVTLTEASLAPLSDWMAAAGATADVHVIPTAVDLDRFRPGPVPERPHLMYVGSIGTWYLLSEMIELVARFLASRPDGRVTFLVNGPGAEVRDAVSGRGLGESVDVRTVGHDQVAAELQTATATFGLIRASPSKVASAPTKIGESLAVGVPVLVNRGVGDSERIVTGERVGVAVDAGQRHQYGSALGALLEMATRQDVRRRCREVAERRFSLEKAADSYEAAYRAARERTADRAIA